MRENKSYIINHEQYKLLIPGYPEGSNITIIETSYVPNKIVNVDKENKSIETVDFITILFRDNTTGLKHVCEICRPLYTFYVLKDKDNVPEYNKFFIEKDKVIPCTCRYKDRLKAIAEVTDRIDEYMDNIRNKNTQENRKLHADPRVFMSDIDIENYYRFLFSLSYTNEIFKLSKGFMDIETDVSYCNNQFPEPGEVPINAIAYCDEAHNIVYQFIYNDKRNPLVEKYRQEVESGTVLTELKQFVINAVGGYKKAVKYNIDNMNYEIMFFDNELEMITNVFLLVNTLIPDFVEFWNMAFDFNFIIERIITLGGIPETIISHPGFSHTFLNYYVDEKNKNLYEERGDRASVSSATVWIDQMIQFASRRKGRNKYPSFKLNAIGEDVANVKKLDYSHITSDLGMLPYIDMKTFSFYNIMDVIVQKCIENTTQDLEYTFTKCLVNNTVYSKCHRQSVYLANRFTKDFYDYGYIIGNNKNKWNEKPATKFPGAMVGDPLHNSKDVMVSINGRPSLLADNVVDFDYSSLYPSIILENNLAPNTQIGKIIIEDPNDSTRTFSLNEHPDMYSSDDEVAKYSRGGEFLENLMSGNPLEFGRRWMSLGNIYQVIDDIKEYFMFNGYYGKPIEYDYSAHNIVSVIDKPIEIVEQLPYHSGEQIVTEKSELTQERKDQLVEEIKKGALL